MSVCVCVCIYVCNPFKYINFSIIYTVCRKKADFSKRIMTLTLITLGLNYDIYVKGHQI
jgi:hypothetical protein